MAKQDDFTPEEWKALSAGPLLAGLYVSMSDASGPVGLVKEGYAVVQQVIGATSSPNDLVKAIAEDVKSAGRRDMPDIPADKVRARSMLLDGVKAASAAAGKAPGDADAYREWVFTAAQKAAAAAKEGGFLGFGGTAVSDAEKAALAELQGALGVKG
jgi:hypothetical protein